MDLKQTRKALGLTLQAAGAAVGITREAVRLAEAGRAPDAAGKLAKHYRAESAKAVKATLKMQENKRMKITLDIRLDKDGGFTVAYSGTDPNTHDLADTIVKALAAAEGLETTKISSKN
jgi:hypothetical protein